MAAVTSVSVAAAMVADVIAQAFDGSAPFLSGFPAGIALHHLSSYLLVALLAVVYFVATIGLQGAVSAQALQANAADAPVYVAQVIGGSGLAKVMALSITLSAIASTGAIAARSPSVSSSAKVSTSSRPMSSALLLSGK